MRYSRIIFLFLALALCLCACQNARAAEQSEQIDFMEQVSFLGDSITAHLPLRSSIPQSRVWVTKERYLNLDSRITYAKIVAPDTGEEERIADVAARLRPAYLVVTLGIDYGVYYYRNDTDTFAHYYEKLIRAIQEASPDTVLLPQSILPVSAACTAVSNEMIDRANERIREISERLGLFYLDTQSVLRDEKGFLREEFCNSEDGIHLSDKAYTVMLGFIRERAVEMGWQA